MTRLMKISGTLASVVLIFLDAIALINSLSLSGMIVFDSFVNNSISCGLFLGACSLCVIYNKAAKKGLTITSLVLFSAAVLIRILAIVLLILERIYATYLAPMTSAQYLELAEYSAFALLAVAVIFLMIFLLKGKLQKTTLALGSTSLIALCAVWVINIYNLITEAVNLSSGVISTLYQFLNGGLAKDIIVVLAYAAVFWALTDINKVKGNA